MPYARLLNTINPMLLGATVILLPLIAVSGFGTGVFARQEVLFWVVIMCSIYLLVKLLRTLSYSRSERSWIIHLSVADLLVAAYFVVGLVNIAVVRHFEVDQVMIWRWGAVTAVYVLARSIKGGGSADLSQSVTSKYAILAALAFSGAIQAITSIGQWAGYIASNHRLFDVTGTFGNPGQLGGFQAVALIGTISLLFSYAGKRKATVLLWSLMAAVIAVSLWLADSRAGYFGAITGLFVLFSNRIYGYVRQHYKIMVPLLTLLITAAGFIVYNHRSESALARLLVWRVSADMVADKPLLGHGACSFGEEYMLYQAEYFERNPHSAFTLVADNVAYPYNELIHILVEQGVVGLIIISGLLWVILAYKSRDKKQIAFKAMLSTLLVFSMFSYPTYVFPLLLLFPLLIGSLESRKIFEIHIPKWLLPVIVASLLVVIIHSAGQIKSYREASDKLRTLFSKNNVGAVDYIESVYPKLRYNRDFKPVYASWLAANKNFPDSSERMLAGDPSCETFCDVGEAYQSKGLYSEAEYYYIKASFMVPTRLRPTYLSWKLYMEQNNAAKAMEYALKIVSMPLKVENTFTISTKTEVRRWLENMHCPQNQRKG